MKNRIFGLRTCPSSEEWQALLRGDLPTSRIEEYEAHLDGCLVCVAQLDALTPSLPDELWEAAKEPATTTPPWAARCQGWTEIAPPAELADEGPLLFERKGKYKSHGPIAFGGMGEVYRAWEIGLERWVAIKVPSRKRRDPKAIARFLEEAPRQAQLEHANIVRVYARDEQDGVPFFAMELVTGETLARAVSERALKPKQIAELMRQVATAVHSAHKVGVFHLDLKPTNIMLTAEGIPKVVDFGLARTLDGPTTQSPARGAGTDEYMAPEQWEDDPESPLERTVAYARTDVYGLGAVLYELLTGRAPVLRAAHRNESRRRVRFDEPTPPHTLSKAVPRDLEAICLRCLRKRPEERFATADALADALGRFINGYPPGECSWPLSLAYLVRRHRTVTATSCAALLVLTLVMSLLVSIWWIHERSEALRVFNEGQKRVKVGQISEGHGQMQSSIGELPFGEKSLRGYFIRSVEALQASLNTEVARFTHTSQIRAAAGSADGRYVAIGDNDGHTILWDLAENTTVLLPTRRDRKPISAAAFNHSGSLCATGDFGGDVVVWDMRSRNVLWECALKECVSFLGFLGKGDQLLTGALDRQGQQMRMWDVLRDGGKELLLESADLRKERTSNIVVSPKGDRFVSISLSNRSLLWDAFAGRVLADLGVAAGTPLQPEGLANTYAAFSADGSRLAVAGEKLTIHDGRTGAVIRQVDACRGQRVHCVAFRDDGGPTLVVGTASAAAVRRVTVDLEVWDDVPLDRPTNPSVFAAFTGHGLLLTGRATKTLRLLQPPPLALPHADLGADTYAHKVVISGDASRIATLTLQEANIVPTESTPKQLFDSIRRCLQVWDARTLAPASQVAVFPDGLFPAKIAYSPTTDTLAVACRHIDKATLSSGSAPVLLGSVTSNGVFLFDRLGDHDTGVCAMAFTPDGEKLITGSLLMPGESPAELICWVIGASEQPFWRIRYSTTVTAIAVAPDGKRLVVGGSDGVLRLLSIDRPLEAISSVDIGDRITAAAFAHRESILAVIDSRDHVRVFDVSDKALALRTEFDQPGSTFAPLQFGPSDDTLYVKGDHGVQRWDLHVTKPIDPVIDFVDGVSTFSVNSSPEAVVAITKTGKLILRAVSRPNPVFGAVVGPQPKPSDVSHHEIERYK
jgi:eukaryotic-like serine/threonine-protein kinase